MIKDLFTKLVSIASPSGLESEVRKYVETELIDLGFETYIDDEGNLMARSIGVGRPVLLSAHLDTVQGLTKVKPIVQNGLVKSVGNTILGADNKASVSAMLASLKQVRGKNRKSIEIVLSVREETDGGVSKMDLSWLMSKIGVSADSGKPIGAIITDTPFIEGFNILVSGISSHSSEPEKGVNALSIASHAISKFQWGQVDDFSTANIGLITGGTAINTTPDKIMLTGEIRSYTKESLEKTKRDLEKTFRKSARLFKGKVRIEFCNYCSGYGVKDIELAAKSVKKIYQKLRIKESFMKDFGGSDANFFNSKGLSVVDIGDGVFNPHTDKEYVSVKDLNRLTDIFSSYITA